MYIFAILAYVAACIGDGVRQSLASLASRDTEGEEGGATALLQAGHTYTQTRRVYCPACDAYLLRQTGGATIELDADGKEYVPDMGLDPSDVHPDGCTCERDPITGARGFLGMDLRGVELTGVRRANDRRDAQLRYTSALDYRAEDMEGSAAVAYMFGDLEEVKRCEIDIEALKELAAEQYAEILETSENRWSVDGANLNTEEMLDSNTGRWEHERDGYLSSDKWAKRVRGEGIDDSPLAPTAPLTSWERAEGTDMSGIDAARAAIEAGRKRWEQYHAIKMMIRRCRSMERRLLGAGRKSEAAAWRKREGLIYDRYMERYREGRDAAIAAGNDWKLLFLTREQLNLLGKEHEFTK